MVLQSTLLRYRHKWGCYNDAFKWVVYLPGVPLAKIELNVTHSRVCKRPHTHLCAHSRCQPFDACTTPQTKSPHTSAAATLQLEPRVNGNDAARQVFIRDCLEASCPDLLSPGLLRQ